MKLYLASKHIQFPFELNGLVGNEDKQFKMQLVVNAFDNYPDDKRLKHISSLKESVDKTNAVVTPLDLRDYIDNHGGLVSVLDDTDMLWVSGGNVFYLRYLLKACGLDSALKRLIHGGLVYGGDSAGAAVIGQDMHGLDLLDDPDEAPELIFKGLDITPFMILPHWGNERYAAEIADTKLELEKYNKEIVILNDSQVCIVNGDERRVIGE
jgi:dipeptidase E